MSNYGRLVQPALSAYRYFWELWPIFYAAGQFPVNQKPAAFVSDDNVADTDVVMEDLGPIVSLLMR